MKRQSAVYVVVHALKCRVNLIRGNYDLSFSGK